MSIKHLLHDQMIAELRANLKWWSENSAGRYMERTLFPFPDALDYTNPYIPGVFHDASYNPKKKYWQASDGYEYALAILNHVDEHGAFESHKEYRQKWNAIYEARETEFRQRRAERQAARTQKSEPDERKLENGQQP